MKMPGGLGTFHIVGIGGIGMSAIAEVMLAMGYKVQGSDLNENDNVRRLRAKGVQIFQGHEAANIDGAQSLVVSTAVKRGNPELEAARAKGMPVIRRAEMLAELMRNRATISVTGTHGKTTTTSFVSALLEEAAFDPMVINGGILKAWGSNARIGKGEWMIVEADESDGTFIRLPTQIGIVTNIDPEHMDFYGNEERLHAAFRTFFRNIPFYGLAIAGIDHPVVREILEGLSERMAGRRLLTYGMAADADLRLENVLPDNGGVLFDVGLSARVRGGAGAINDLRLPVPGHYNALNALAALAVALELGIPEPVFRKAFAEYQGVARRFTPTGNWNGVSFYDDYAHHPVEVKAVLQAASSTTAGRVIAIMQPHRYTRLQSLFDEFCDCFSNAGTVVITPVFEAGEDPIEGIDRDHLVKGIRDKGHRSVLASEGGQALAPIIADLAHPGDLVICLGAGDITGWAHALPGWLAQTGEKTEKIA